YDTSGDITRIPIVLPPKASVFIVFRRNQSSVLGQTIRSVSHNGKTLLITDGRQAPPQIEILSAVYGKPGEPQHTRDVKTIIQKLVDNGETIFPVVKIAAIGGDPDINVVKTLDVRYRNNANEEHILLHDGDVVDFSVHSKSPLVAVEMGTDGGIQVCVTEPGDYLCALSSGKTVAITIPSIPEPITIQGPWTVKFPAGWGVPSQIQLDELIAWNKHPDAGVRYFSGTALYYCEFNVLAELLTRNHRIELDLGDVAVMSDVTLNGEHLGVFWKPPFRMDATSVLRAGKNILEIAVANLWVNRMIGDHQLPPDVERNPNGTLKNWPQWLLEGKPSPTGRFTFTTWELWRKTDPLVESGLIGLVRLKTTVCKRINS
ncbi:MAG: glycosylhydrolase-like jelly roll fold domain-containing protein, partial [Limisphaerales bacterium]